MQKIDIASENELTQVYLTPYVKSLTYMCSHKQSTNANDGMVSIFAAFAFEQIIYGATVAVAASFNHGKFELKPASLTAPAVSLGPGTQPDLALLTITAQARGIKSNEHVTTPSAENAATQHVLALVHGDGFCQVSALPVCCRRINQESGRNLELQCRHLFPIHK